MMNSAETSFLKVEKVHSYFSSAHLIEQPMIKGNSPFVLKAFRENRLKRDRINRSMLSDSGVVLEAVDAKQACKENATNSQETEEAATSEVFRIDLLPGNAALHMLYDIQEEAAKRIAHRLHDESAQMLATVYLELAEIARESSDSTGLKIDKVVTHLDEVCEQLRKLSHELRPLILDQLGLLPALQLLAAGVRQRSGITVVISGHLDGASTERIETVLYRVVQEALSNVVRHAGATHVDVKLWTENNTAHCTFTDNGIGLRAPQENSGAFHGLGLVGIHERLAMLKGSCKIVSTWGKGMELQIEIPL